MLLNLKFKLSIKKKNSFTENHHICNKCGKIHSYQKYFFMSQTSQLEMTRAIAYASLNCRLNTNNMLETATGKAGRFQSAYI